MNDRSNTVYTSMIGDAGAFGRLMVQQATLATGRETLRLYDRFVDAHPGSSSPDLRADAIQAAVDAVVASGKAARIVIDEPGDWYVIGDHPGYISPWALGIVNLSLLPPGTVIKLGAGVRLILPENVMVGVSYWYDMFMADRTGLDLTIEGPGEIDLNSINQPGWVGHNPTPYTQIFGSCAVRGTVQNHGRFERIHVRDLTISNTFANSILLCGYSTTGVFGGTAIIERVRAFNFGEGPEIDVCENAYMLGNEATFNDNVFGDVLETANCNYATLIGNRWKHASNTNPPVIGAIFDCGGTFYVYMADNEGLNDRALYSAQTTTTIFPGTARRNIYTYCNGLKGRGLPSGAIFPGHGASDWYGVDLLNCAVGFNFTGSTLYTDQRHVIHSPRIQGTGTPFLLEGDVDVRILDPNVSAAGESIRLYRSSSFEGVPKCYVRGGSLRSTNSDTIRNIGTGYAGVFAPIAQLDGVSLACAANEGIIETVGSNASVQNFTLNNCLFDVNSGRKTGVVARCTVIANATGLTRVIKIPPGLRLIPESIIARGRDVTGGSGTFTAQIGTVAGSYADLAASTVLDVTAVGQPAEFTLATAAAPIGTGTGTEIYVSVTSASPSTQLRVDIDIIGRLVGDPVYDNPSGITGFAWELKWPFNLYSDLGTTPATPGGLIRRWSTYRGTALNFDASSDANRVNNGQGGLFGNGTGSLQLGSIDLSGAFTIFVRVKTGPSNANQAWFGVRTGSTGWGWRNANAPLEWLDSPDVTPINIANAASTWQVVGCKIAADGTTTLVKPDGTTVAGGNTAKSATSIINILIATFVSGACNSDRGISGVLCFNAVTSAADDLRIITYMES